MAALCNRAGHYKFSSPNLGGQKLDVYLPYFYTRCDPSANVDCKSEMCCMRLAGNAGPKKRQKFAIWAPSHHRAITLQLRHLSAIGNKNSSGDEIANVNFYAVRPRKLPEFAEITQNNGHYPFKVIQGHRFCYHSKAHRPIRFPISD